MIFLHTKSSMHQDRLLIALSQDNLHQT